MDSAERGRKSADVVAQRGPLLRLATFRQSTPDRDRRELRPQLPLADPGAAHHRFHDLVGEEFLEPGLDPVLHPPAHRQLPCSEKGIWPGSLATLWQARDLFAAPAQKAWS